MTHFSGLLLWGALLLPLAAQQPQHAAKEPNSLQGPVLYKAYCASCHGTNATGNGPMAESLKVAPADLTRIAARNGGVFPRARISRVISGEEIPAKGHGTSDMPVWGPIFSHVEADQDLGRVRIDNLARYLDQLQKR